MHRFYLASNNLHKLEEFQLLARAHPQQVEIHSAREIGGMPAVVEDAGTFAGNARKKAWALLGQLPPGSWALADDSGLCVDALGDNPGVESAYYAGPEGDSSANLAKLVRDLLKLGTPAPVSAHFICVLSAVSPSRGELLVTGRLDGTVSPESRGEGGFGYDSIFRPLGMHRTLAEISALEKNSVSHRARAFAALIAALPTK